MIWAIYPSGILFFAGLYTLLKHHGVLRLVRGRGTNIPDKGGTSNVPGYDEVVISQRLVSLLMALAVSTIGLFAVWETRNDVMVARSPLILPASLFFVAYFPIDLYSMYEVYKLRKVERLRRSFARNLCGCFGTKAIFVIHHLVVAFCGPVIVQYDVRRNLGDFFIGCFLCFEISTIFLSIHYILKQVGKTDMAVVHINGTLFLISYFVFRVVMFPFMYMIYAYQYHQGNLLVAMEMMPWLCHVVLAFGFVMQFYWFVEAVLNAKRVFLQREEPT